MVRTLRRRKDVTGLVDSAKLDGRTLSNAIEDCELDVYPSKFDICIGNTKVLIKNGEKIGIHFIYYMFTFLSRLVSRQKLKIDSIVLCNGELQLFNLCKHLPYVIINLEKPFFYLF